jgi:hypothetical protein
MKYLILALMLTSCGSTAGVFGLASTGDLEERAEDLQAYADRAALARQEQTHAGVLAAVEPIEPLLPGLGRYVEARLKESPYTPPPPVPPKPEEPLLPWWMEEAATALVGAGLAYVGVNRVRDSRRRQRGESVEAKA